MPFEKGGGYAKWFGHHVWTVDWQDAGKRLKAFTIARYGNAGKNIKNEQLCFSRGWSYSYMARGSLGLRAINGDAVFSHLASAVTFKNSEDEHPAIPNCRFGSLIARALSAKIQLNESYVSRVPLPEFVPPSLSVIEIACVQMKQRLVGANPTERSFGVHLLPRRPFDFGGRIADAVNLHTFEGLSEQLVFGAYRLDAGDISAVLDETGMPVGWQPFIVGYDAMPEIASVIPQAPAELGVFLAERNRLSADDNQLAKIRSRLRSLFEAGPGAQPDDESATDKDSSDEDDEDAVTVGACIPIPAETFLEELSQKLEVHPISVYWLLKEGIERNGWRCLPEERRLWGDRVTVAVLRLLGHRWPKQVEANEPVPDWSDVDGIIPLTPLVNESTLSERVLQRLSAVAVGWDSIPTGGLSGRVGMESQPTFADPTSDFAEVMNKPLDAWLATEFFKHHTKQFKKRPIAWQLQSGSFTARSTPAIACLLYYHKLDSDLLRKVRKLAEDLRKSRETELRGLLSVAPETRSDRQEKRRVELDDAVVELQRFDATLEAVATTGFGPDSLRPTLRQYALNDALLALKARWLRRLSELIAKGPLRDCLKAANKTDLHPDFGSWIANAMSHLDYFCARVDPVGWDSIPTISSGHSLPTGSSVGRVGMESQPTNADPTAADLAKLIAAEAKTILTESLRLACDVWWKPFDEAVLQPLKARVKELKDEQKQCEARLQADPEPEPPEVRELKTRVKELKAEIKVLNADIAEKSGLAQAVRESIEAWRSKEPQTWGDWLAEQPLFDQVSSLDHRRPAPTTIAEFIAQESLYAPDINDGVRVNIAPLQKAGLLAAEVLAAKDLDKAIADRADWRSDERRWVREGKLPQCGWWSEGDNRATTVRE